MWTSFRGLSFWGRVMKLQLLFLRKNVRFWIPRASDRSQKNGWFVRKPQVKTCNTMPLGVPNRLMYLSMRMPNYGSTSASTCSYPRRLEFLTQPK